MIILDPIIHMWAVVALTGITMLMFALERYPIEVTALALLAALLLLFEVFPLIDADGVRLITARDLLAGFANESLIAVLALLVMGQGMAQTDALTPITRGLMRLSRRRNAIGILVALTGVLLISGAMNNTPLVIMFIPVMQDMAVRLGWSTSRLMMPLSFAAILGGMTTVIGSSTNLLVSSSLEELGYEPISFFEFTIPGLFLAGIGLVYVIFLLPRLLPERRSLSGELLGAGRQFMAELDIGTGSPLIGERPVAGHFKKLPNMTVRLIQRGEQTMLPPFEDYAIEAGDIMIVAATRQAITEVLRSVGGHLLSPIDRQEADPDDERPVDVPRPARRTEEHVLAEVMIAPASRLVDLPLEQVSTFRRSQCIVLGIQRRARMVRARVGEIRLQAGDVLLILGTQSAIDDFRINPDVLLLAGSLREMPQRERAAQAGTIFLGTIALAATNALPISVAAVIGSALMMFSGCLNIRQAVRAIDRRILLVVVSTLALGSAMGQTGGAAYIASALLDLLHSTNPLLMVSVFFIIVAIATNLLSNNACAILFTPIGVSLALQLQIDPHIFAIAVIFGANCSFATPIGYQTNLLVLGPGHYRFLDFLRGGLPLVVLIWLGFLVVAEWYYGL